MRILKAFQFKRLFFYTFPALIMTPEVNFINILRAPFHIIWFFENWKLNLFVSIYIVTINPSCISKNDPRNVNQLLINILICDHTSFSCIYTRWINFIFTIREQKTHLFLFIFYFYKYGTILMSNFIIIDIWHKNIHLCS